MTIFTRGDLARYTGDVTWPMASDNDDNLAEILTPGDDVTVIEGNEDYDDEAIVERDGARYAITAELLEWLGSVTLPPRTPTDLHPPF